MAIALQHVLSRPGALVLAVAVPVALSMVYLVHVDAHLTSHTTVISGRRQSSIAAPQQPRDPTSLDLDLDQPDLVVVYERVESSPVPASRLVHPLPGSSSRARGAAASPLLHGYTRAVHRAFGLSPQALLLRALTRNGETRSTFASAYIDQLPLCRGQLVNGVYAISSLESPDALGSERVEMSIQVPAPWPSVDGLVVAAIEPVSPRAWDAEEPVDDVIFVNETWMWRRVHDGPTLLETRLGGWFHSRLSAWLVLRGMAAVVKANKQ
ncbi:hypothetical protein CDD82_2007 [Ophiocordyceps australis]|uniref:Uncharacterized protein n=1 Tax=Ophiocordyceps australis TaxID=1399860 RepID=A0A2C5XH30_9HYPO|nr:hypothetical protein CDD82_2007 [Ophiocordyceps australis]